MSVGVNPFGILDQSRLDRLVGASGTAPPIRGDQHRNRERRIRLGPGVADGIRDFQVGRIIGRE